MTTFSLENHAALVTGSSKGIGLAIGLGLREAGAKVVFHGSNARPADVPTGCDYITANLFEPSAPADLLQAAIAAQPGLNLLICNAGSFFDLTFLQMTRELWKKTIELNVTATYFVSQEIAKYLVSQKREGAIVVVSSTNGTQAERDSTAYDTSKGALVMLTKSLALSLADYGIRVNGLAPGLIHTPLTARWLDDRADLRQHYEKKSFSAKPARRKIALEPPFFCSPAARSITGHILTVDGGLTTGQIGKL